MPEIFIKIFEAGGYGLLSAAGLAIVGGFFLKLFRQLMAENKAEREELRANLKEERARSERMSDKYITSVDGIYTQMGERHSTLLATLSTFNTSLTTLHLKVEKISPRFRSPSPSRPKPKEN